MCRNAIRATFFCGFLAQRCFAYIENSHGARASLACGAGSLQNRFYLRHRSQHHRVVFHVDLSVLSTERHTLIHILTSAATELQTQGLKGDRTIKLSFFALVQLFFRLSLFTTWPPHLHHLPRALFYLHLLSCLVSFSPGDRVQVIDDSNEEWWKVGNKSCCTCKSSCVLMLVCTVVCVLNQVFKLSYYCVTPAPYLHLINMQAATDRNRTSFSLEIIELH